MRARGRHCAICGKPGGQGMAAALKLLLDAGAGKGWHSTEWRDGKAHGPCVMREKRRANEATITATVAPPDGWDKPVY